jgi:hypothetical protein
MGRERKKGGEETSWTKAVGGGMRAPHEVQHAP